jgi:hypothetical protein
MRTEERKMESEKGEIIIKTKEKEGKTKQKNERKG